MSRIVLPKVTRTAFGIAVFATASAFCAHAQSGKSDLQFEVASIKHGDPNFIGSTWSGGPGTSDPGRFTAKNTRLEALAFHAYGAKYQYQIDSKSGWMRTELYDVAAGVPAGATKEQFQIMLQRLLAERFGLVVHHETRQLPGYRLVVAEGGAKLKKSLPAPAKAGEAAPGSSPPQPDLIIKHDGTPQLSDSAGPGVWMTLAGAILRGRHENMKGLADRLVGRLNAPVLEATGLAGEYDYDVSFVPEGIPLSQANIVSPLGAGAATTQQADAAPPDGRPTLRTAIKEQLGLKLETVKAVPVEVLVLDKANREPTGN